MNCFLALIGNWNLSLLEKVARQSDLLSVVQATIRDGEDAVAIGMTLEVRVFVEGTEVSPYLSM